MDEDKCVGCGACTNACPWHMPTVNPVTRKSSKCIMCGGGMASVLDSKHVKALVCRGTGAVKIARPRELKLLSDHMLREIIGSNNNNNVPMVPQSWAEFTSNRKNRWYGAPGRVWGKAPNGPIDTGEQPVGDTNKFAMESLPDVDDPFPPFEPEPEPEAPPELTEAQILAEYIRVRTANAELTPRKLLEAEIENLEQLLAGMAEDESCATIVSITGERDVYYYDNDIMTDNYARIAMLVADKNIPRTIAEMVRWNCRIYPSPTPTEYFIRHPYYYTKIQLDAALRQMAKDERYQDILSFNSARGNPYLYSSKEMSLRYAVALANGMEDDELNK